MGVKVMNSYRYEFIYGGEYANNSRIDMAPLTNSACRVINIMLDIIEMALILSTDDDADDE